jgi:glycosyltransferase involved in cell wall biosynthesis
VSKPKVSICLPVFNGADFLAGAIESVQGQSFPDFELIIVDDVSTDASGEIIQKYAARDDRIVFSQNTRRLGLFANYNACLALANGDYVKLFAQDDLLQANAIATMVDIFDKYPEVSLVTGGKIWIDQNGRETKKILQFSQAVLIAGKEVVIANLIGLGNWVGEPSTVMFRTKDIGGGFDCSYYHYGDIEYWFRLLARGCLYYIDDVICKFRRHEASSTTTNLSGLYFALDIFRLGEQYKDILAELGESPEHFAKRAVETVALQVDHLVRNEGLNVEKVTAAKSRRIEAKSLYSEALATRSEVAGSGSEKLEFRAAGAESRALEPETTPARSGSRALESESGAHSSDPVALDNELLRQSVFHFSRRITELLQELIETKNELEHRQAECERLWKAVNQMSNSVSWRLTAPLRTVREKMNQTPVADKSE